MKKNLQGYLLIMPAVLLLGVLFVFPVSKTIVNSFLNVRTIMAKDVGFIGLRNYADMFSDSIFLDAITWTIQFTILTVIFSVTLAMIFALIMKRKFKGQSFVRVVILMPWAIPAIIAGLIWTDIFGYSGLINSALVGLNLINERINFFGSPETAKLAIIVADVWKSTPYSALLILAGLMGIPDTYYEAAQLDGAGKIKQFLFITVPLLLPTLSVVVMFRLISALRSYGLVVAMTGGGPGGTTQTISMYAVLTYFRFGKTSYGAAIAIFMMIISLFFSLLFLRNLREKSKV